MGLFFHHLDDATRPLMIGEIEADIASTGLYVSNYLNEVGANLWSSLLVDGARAGTDDSLATALDSQKCFKLQVERRKPKGGYSMVAVPYTAAQTLAESQFNMYYIRALAIRALSEGKRLLVYRAKEVENPRDTSQQMIGTYLDPQTVLDVLRATKGVEPVTNIPMPNSGLSVRLV